MFSILVIYNKYYKQNITNDNDVLLKKIITINNGNKTIILF